MAKRRKYKNSMEMRNLLKDTGRRLENNKEAHEKLGDKINEMEKKLEKFGENSEGMSDEKAQDMRDAINKEIEETINRQEEFEQIKQELIGKTNELIEDIQSEIDFSESDQRRLSDLGQRIENIHSRKILMQQAIASLSRKKIYENLAKTGKQILDATS